MSGMCCSQSAVQFKCPLGQCVPCSDEKDVHSKGQLCPIFLLKVNYRMIVNGYL